MTEYRWGRASGGEIPSGTWEQGHGWRWRDTDDGGQEKQLLWIVRSLPDETGSVRLGYVARGESAVVGPEYHEHPVDEYEVLLDEATWERAEWIEEDDGSCWEDIRPQRPCLWVHRGRHAAVRHAARPRRRGIPARREPGTCRLRLQPHGPQGTSRSAGEG